MAAPDQVALITTGDLLLAEGIARELLHRQFAVLIQGRREDELAAAVEALASDCEWTDQVLTFACEESDPDHREQLVEFLLEEFKRIDLLVSVPPPSAPEGDLLSLPPEKYATVIEAGQTAPLFVAQMVANEMARLREAGEIESGKIVLVNSMGAETTLSDRPAECIAAAARAAMTRLFADAVSEHGINVYEVRAGLIFTEGLDDAHRHYNRLIHDGLIPLRRWGRAQDVGLTVAAIATDLLPFSTGQVIDVDGGFHLKRL